MKITYSHHSYNSANDYTRYVRFDGKTFKFCECNPFTLTGARYDIRQGEVSEVELPNRIVEAAKAKYGHFPSYVEWPYEE